MTRDDFDRDIWCLLGIPVDAIDMSSATRVISSAAVERRRCFLSTPNVNFLVGCQSDADFRRSVIDSELSVADGMPLIWLAKLLGIPLRERVSGSGLIEELRDNPINRDQRISVFFFGGEEGVAEQACRALKETQTGLSCAGYFNPGFGSIKAMSSNEIIDAINDSNADFVIVSLGAKKGQAWIQRNQSRLHASVISHLGAVVNFIAGTVNRAPKWMQRVGLEWFWRIMEEPALWRRYWSDGIALARMVVTKVLPYLLWRLFGKGGAIAPAGASKVEMLPEDENFLITLSGNINHSNLGEIRQVFRMAASRSQDVIINFEAVSCVDPALLGLLMMLEKHVAIHGKKLYLTRLPKKIANIFNWNGLGHLVE